jgi:hypothetical protein
VAAAGRGRHPADCRPRERAEQLTMVAIPGAPSFPAAMEVGWLPPAANPKRTQKVPVKPQELRPKMRRLGRGLKTNCPPASGPGSGSGCPARTDGSPKRGQSEYRQMCSVAKTTASVSWGDLRTSGSNTGHDPVVPHEAAAERSERHQSMPSANAFMINIYTAMAQEERRNFFGQGYGHDGVSPRLYLSNGDSLSHAHKRRIDRHLEGGIKERGGQRVAPQCPPR